MDVKQGFDTVLHEAVGASLLWCGVSQEYCEFLALLYRDMWASVSLSPVASSRLFRLRRGVRQGDPLSLLFFATVIAHILEPLKASWESRSLGLGRLQTVQVT